MVQVVRFLATLSAGVCRRFRCSAAMSVAVAVFGLGVGEASASTTGTLGNPIGVSQSSLCPAGTVVEGFDVSLESRGYVYGVASRCRSGSGVVSDAPVIGGVFLPFVASSCGSTPQVGVGLYGRSGDIVDGVGARCNNGEPPTTSALLVTGGGGGPGGPFDCPAGEQLTGLQGTVEYYFGRNVVSSLTGLCAELKHPTTTSVTCSPQPVVAGQSTTCTATVTDMTTPTGTVSFKTSGPGSFNEASCELTMVNASSASCSVTYTPGSTPAEPVRSDTITAEYGGDDTHKASKGTTTVAVISPTALASGSFVIGDENATVGKSVVFSNTEVEWWGSNWWKENSLSGGPAPSAFKGFAETSSSPPMCGESWTTNTGNSSGPPLTVPEYMEVIAASKITQSGSTITGNAPEVVVVKTNPGYLPNPGHKGTGKVIAIVCKL
jgi:Bacterial Ig-like domain (group 3)